MGRDVLVTELIKCDFRAENWFPSAPCPKTTTHITDTGSVACDLRTLLTEIPGARPVAENETARSRSSQTAAVSEGPGLAAPSKSEAFWPPYQATLSPPAISNHHLRLERNTRNNSQVSRAAATLQLTMEPKTYTAL